MSDAIIYPILLKNKSRLMHFNVVNDALYCLPVFPFAPFTNSMIYWHIDSSSLIDPSLPLFISMCVFIAMLCAAGYL